MIPADVFIPSNLLATAVCAKHCVRLKKAACNITLTTISYAFLRINDFYLLAIETILKFIPSLLET